MVVEKQAQRNHTQHAPSSETRIPLTGSVEMIGAYGILRGQGVYFAVFSIMYTVQSKVVRGKRRRLRRRQGYWGYVKVRKERRGGAKVVGRYNHICMVKRRINNSVEEEMYDRCK